MPRLKEIPDVPVITGAISSPWWVYYLTEFNVVLSTLLTLLGIVLACVKIYKASNGKQE